MLLSETVSSRQGGGAISGRGKGGRGGDGARGRWGEGKSSKNDGVSETRMRLRRKLIQVRSGSEAICRALGVRGEEDGRGAFKRRVLGDMNASEQGELKSKGRNDWQDV